MVALAFAGRIRFGAKSSANPNTLEEIMLKTVTIIASLSIGANVVHAASTRCVDASVEKQLSGDFKTGFISKCLKDECDSSAAEQKLDGATKAGFIRKRVADGLKPCGEEKYADKKLSDTARIYFINQCRSGKDTLSH